MLLSDLRFDRGYHDPTDLSRGYLDFDRDGKSDVFGTIQRTDGSYQWRYSSGATMPWLDLAYDTTPPDQLRFGDFNGDGYTDVFATAPRLDGTLQWMYSSRGTNSYTNLAFDATPLDQLRFGDFNGDGRTDVFTTQDIGGGMFAWTVSYSGTTNYHEINSASTLLSDMQFGDINGDGHTDVFTTQPDVSPNTWNWLYSSAGTAAYQSIVLNNLSVHDVRLIGDFNKDHRSDWFSTTARFDGLFQWWYEYYPPSPGAVGNNPLACAATDPAQLRFGDFNGDGYTDVFALVQTCKAYLPAVMR